MKSQEKHKWIQGIDLLATKLSKEHHHINKETECCNLQAIIQKSESNKRVKKLRANSQEMHPDVRARINSPYIMGMMRRDEFAGTIARMKDY